MWVIYTQTEPFAGNTGDEVMTLVRANPDHRFALPPWMDAAVAGAVGRCWVTELGARPSMEAVKASLAARWTGDEVGGDPTEAYL